MCSVSNLRNYTASISFLPQMIGLTHQATEHYPAKTGEYPSNVPLVVFKRSHVLRKIFDGCKTIFVSTHCLFLEIFLVQILSAEKHRSIFSHHMEAIVDFSTLDNTFPGWETILYIDSPSMGIPALEFDNPPAFISEKHCKIKISHPRTHIIRTSQSSFHYTRNHICLYYRFTNDLNNAYTSEHSGVTFHCQIMNKG